jgi:guanylate kinase
MKNKIIVITAPSGSGKTTLVKEILDEFSNIEFSISACTRKKRDNEVEGKDYYFISIDEFKKNIKSHEFVEWEMVYENKYYGTLKSEFKRIWNNGKIPIVDIDVKGALCIKEKYKDCITIFIEVPILLLKQRLEKRGTETEDSLKERISKSTKELEFKNIFDVVVLNKDFDEATYNIKNIIKSYI